MSRNTGVDIGPVASLGGRTVVELSDPSESCILHSSVLRGLWWQHSLVTGQEEASAGQDLGRGAGKEQGAAASVGLVRLANCSSFSG